MVRVGAGTHVYEQVEDWEKLPEGWVLGQTAIVTDSQDRVYLFNRGEHPLIVLDRHGNFLNSWGEGQLPDAHGMFIDGEDNLYMPVKNSHVVLKYRPDGNLLMRPRSLLEMEAGPAFGDDPRQGGRLLGQPQGQRQPVATGS